MAPPQHQNPSFWSVAVAAPQGHPSLGVQRDDHQHMRPADHPSWPPSVGGRASQPRGATAWPTGPCPQHGLPSPVGASGAPQQLWRTRGVPHQSSKLFAGIKEMAADVFRDRGVNTASDAFFGDSSGDSGGGYGAGTSTEVEQSGLPDASPFGFGNYGNFGFGAPGSSPDLWMQESDPSRLGMVGNQAGYGDAWESGGSGLPWGGPSSTFPCGDFSGGGMIDGGGFGNADSTNAVLEGMGALGEAVGGMFG